MSSGLTLLVLWKPPEFLTPPLPIFIHFRPPIAHWPREPPSIFVYHNPHGLAPRLTSNTNLQFSKRRARFDLTSSGVLESPACELAILLRSGNAKWHPAPLFILYYKITRKSGPTHTSQIVKIHVSLISPRLFLHFLYAINDIQTRAPATSGPRGLLPVHVVRILRTATITWIVPTHAPFSYVTPTIIPL